MPEENAGVRIDVGVGVGYFSVLLEDVRHDLVDGINHLEELVVREVLQCKLPLASVPRIGLAQDGMAITGNDLLIIQGLPSD